MKKVIIALTRKVRLSQRNGYPIRASSTTIKMRLPRRVIARSLSTLSSGLRNGSHIR